MLGLSTRERHGREGSPMPVAKMDHHNRTTAERIYRHPTSHNIQWHDVKTLLESLGECRENKHDSFEVKAGDILGFIHGPLTRELTIDQVVQTRHLLRDLGVTEDALVKHAS